MTLLAGLAVGWCCAAIAAQLVGVSLPWPSRSQGHRRGNALALWLQQAGLPVQPAQFVVASIASGVVVLAVLGAVVGPVVALVPALVAAAAPRAFYGRRRAQRLTEVQRAWPDGLRDVLVSISAGQSVGQAVTELAEHGPPALRDAFARYPALRRSLGTVPALESVREDLADPVSDRVIEVLVLAAERGGAIVRTILEDLTAGITADLKLDEELRTSMLESRINARAVVALPWLVLLVLNVGNGPFRAFYRSTGGLVTVAIGALLSVAGSALIARLGRLPDEQRVFGGSGVAA
jgi:tight adherence protein B